MRLCQLIQRQVHPVKTDQRPGRRRAISRCAHYSVGVHHARRVDVLEAAQVSGGIHWNPVDRRGRPEAGTQCEDHLRAVFADRRELRRGNRKLGQWSDGGAAHDLSALQVRHHGPVRRNRWAAGAIRSLRKSPQPAAVRPQGPNLTGQLRPAIRVIAFERNHRTVRADGRIAREE